MSGAGAFGVCGLWCDGVSLAGLVFLWYFFKIGLFFAMFDGLRVFVCAGVKFRGFLWFGGLVCGLLRQLCPLI